jgi:hypothetical protein
MQITVVDLQTGQANIGSLKAIASVTGKSIKTLNQFKRNKVSLFGTYAISFNTNIIKYKHKGNVNNMMFKIRQRELSNTL